MAYKAKLLQQTVFFKYNCIGWLIGCNNRPVQEAIYANAYVRCCTNEDCELLAIQLAVDQGTMIIKNCKEV